MLGILLNIFFLQIGYPWLRLGRASKAAGKATLYFMMLDPQAI